jgi:hypothetical protein
MHEVLGSISITVKQTKRRLGAVAEVYNPSNSGKQED